MTNAYLTSLAAVALAAMSAGSALASDVLHIYNWTGYTSEQLLKDFTSETGIEVSLDTFDTNETLLAKLRSGSAGYDITIASTDFVPIMIDEGLVQKVDIKSLPNYENLSRQWKVSGWDMGNQYSIPWHWGVTSFQVDTSVYDGPMDSLSLLFEPPAELQGKVGMFNSPTEAIALAMRYLDIAPCTTDPEELRKIDAVLQAQKPYVKIYDIAGVSDRLISGETPISQIANGEALRARTANPNLKFVFAKEGGVAWVDNVVVPTDAQRPDLALKFINFIMDPKNAATEQAAIGYPTGVSEATALLPEEIAQAPEVNLPEGYKTVVNPVCSAEAMQKYDLIWTRLRQ